MSLQFGGAKALRPAAARPDVGADQSETVGVAVSEAEQIEARVRSPSSAAAAAASFLREGGQRNSVAGLNPFWTDDGAG